ncbi:MAG: hypothetical protein ACLP0J_03530 [Solirubrobacteraceae bacterium]|jgi:hypothetical protein
MDVGDAPAQTRAVMMSAFGAVSPDVSTFLLIPGACWNGLADCCVAI